MSADKTDSELNTLLEYLDAECIGTDTGVHGFNYDNAEKAIKQYAAKERDTLLDELEAITNEYGTEWVEQMGISEVRDFVVAKRIKIPGGPSMELSDNTGVQE